MRSAGSLNAATFGGNLRKRRPSGLHVPRRTMSMPRPFALVDICSNRLLLPATPVFAAADSPRHQRFCEHGGRETATACAAATPGITVSRRAPRAHQATTKQSAAPRAPAGGVSFSYGCATARPAAFTSGVVVLRESRRTSAPSGQSCDHDLANVSPPGLRSALPPRRWKQPRRGSRINFGSDSACRSQLSSGAWRRATSSAEREPCQAWFRFQFSYRCEVEPRSSA